MLERRDAVTIEVLAPITFVLTYPTVRQSSFCEWRHNLEQSKRKVLHSSEASL